MATRLDLIALAGEKLGEVIDILEIACDGDDNVRVYLIDQLKTFHSSNSGLLSNNLNIDEVAMRFLNNHNEYEDVGGDEFFETD